MGAISRRSLIVAASALSATAIAGCSSTATSSGTQTPGAAGSKPAGPPVKLRWQDHFSTFQKFHADWAKQLSAKENLDIEFTYIEASKAPQAWQLAHQSKQMPDVFSNVIGIPLPALIKDNWVSEAKLSQAALDYIPKSAFAENLSTAGGKVYGLPVMSGQQYWALPWFNKEYAAKAGVDVKDQKWSYDQFIELLKKFKAAGGSQWAPMMLALGDPGRMRDHIDDLAQAGGFPGYQGVQYVDGAYGYTHPAYEAAVELYKRIKVEGLLAPGAESFSVANSRQRWASGAAACYMDGPWCPGGSKVLVPTFVDKIEVSEILLPGSGERTTYRGAPGPTFYISSDSKDPEAASKIFNSMATPEYFAQLASMMDQPPLDLDSVEKSDAIEPYKRVIGYFKKTVKLAPTPLAKPGIAAVAALMKPITPHLGNIIQGYLGGDVTDLKAALKKLNDQYSAEREVAVKEAAKTGSTASAADWGFSDWKPGGDYKKS